MASTQRTNSAEVGSGAPDHHAIHVERIDGVGPAYAADLARIGIETCEQLVGRAPARLVEEFHAVGITIGVHRIEGWVEKAERLLAERDGATSETLRTAPAHDAPAAEDGDWRQRGEFTIWFEATSPEAGERWRARIYDAALETEDVLETNDPSAWFAFLLERSGYVRRDEPAADVDPELDSSMPPPVPPLPPVVRIEGCSLARSEGTTPSVVATVRFRLVGANADVDAEAISRTRAPFRSEVLGVDTSTDGLAFVGSHDGRLEAGTTEYATAHEFPIPSRGSYEVHCSVVLLTVPDGVAHDTGPTLRVVPSSTPAST